MLRNEIRIPARDQGIHSPGLARLIQAVEGSPRVPFTYLLEEDSDPRSVHNFVARLRKLTSPQAVSIRGQEVLRGPSWPGALIVHGDAQTAPRLDDFSVSLGRENFVASDAHLQAARSLLSLTFTRRDLEKHLRVSKATACRMLESWMKMGRIQCQGKAKSIVYHWVSANENLVPTGKPIEENL